MPQSLAQILLHYVFSTRDRRPFFRDNAIRGEMHRYLGGILKRHDCQPIIAGGVADHVHIFCALSRTHTVADVVKELKRGSTIWIKGRDRKLDECAWQGGYGAFSIGASQAPQVKGYIARQEEHHCRISFQDELRELLQRYGIEFDERYVWD